MDHANLIMACLSEGTKGRTRVDQGGTRVGKSERSRIKGKAACRQADRQYACD